MSDIKKITEIIERCVMESFSAKSSVTGSDIDIRFNEPMSGHTTFKVGGTADCVVTPGGEGFVPFCLNLFKYSRIEEIPLFIIGGGANIVVSDKGIRGIVLDMSGWKGEYPAALCESEETLILKSGTGIDEAANIASSKNLCGLEFLAGMPGTIGGAVWMNARCYGKEIADNLKWAQIVVNEQITGNSEQLAVRSEKGEEKSETGTDYDYVVRKLEIENKKILNSQFSTFNYFDYKLSPFQKIDCLILSAAFNLKKGDKGKILSEMEKNRQDRRDKGHYLFPCAGSAFKNNRDFGKPTGQIIDELGLKGFQIGGAQIAPFHGNIIINTGNASASDIRALVDEVAARVKAAAGFDLEPEILFVGGE